MTRILEDRVLLPPSPPSPPSSSSSSYLSYVMTLLVVPFLHFFGGQILQMLNTWFQELRRFFKNKLKSLCKEILKWLEDEDLDGNNVFRREGSQENNSVQRDTGERDTGDTQQGNNATIRGASEEDATGERDTGDTQQGNNATIRRASEEDAAGVENTGTATATEANRTTTQSPPNSPSVRELRIPIAEAQDALPFPEFTDFEVQILHLLEEIISLGIFSILKVIFK